MKKAMLTTTVLLGTLLAGAPVAAAAPPFAGPGDLVAPTVPPEPEPCAATTCDLTAPTPVDKPTDVANPTVTPDPVEPPAEDSDEPGGDEPSGDNPSGDNPSGDNPARNLVAVPSVATTAPQPRPREALSGATAPHDVEAAAGPVDPANWWPLAVPLLGLLGLTAAGTVVAIRRSVQRPS